MDNNVIDIIQFFQNHSNSDIDIVSKIIGIIVDINIFYLFLPPYIKKNKLH